MFWEPVMVEWLLTEWPAITPNSWTRSSFAALESWWTTPPTIGWWSCARSTAWRRFSFPKIWNTWDSACPPPPSGEFGQFLPSFCKTCTRLVQALVRLQWLHSRDIISHLSTPQAMSPLPISDWSLVSCIFAQAQLHSSEGASSLHFPARARMQPLTSRRVRVRPRDGFLLWSRRPEQIERNCPAKTLSLLDNRICFARLPVDLNSFTHSPLPP